MPFSDPSPTVELLGERQFRVAQTFIYTLAEPLSGLPPGLAVEIPEGMTTDLASVPRLLWPILPPHGSYGPAAIVHDWLYRHHTIDGQAMITRAQADAIFLAAMQELGVGWATRWTIYLAVRIGAWWAWKG